MATCSEIIFFHLTVFCTIQVCPETIVGFIGGSIVIPCSSEEHQPSIQDITVRWKQNGLNVYDIIKGTGSVEGQDPAFKNRAETFPKEYLNGNFSLKLNSIQHTDGGQYICYIIEESIMRNVHLIIEEKPVRGSFSQGTKPQPEMTVIIISILCIGIFSLAVSTFSMHDQHEPHIVSRLQFLIKYCNDVPELRHRTFYGIGCDGPKPELKKEGLEKDAFTLIVSLVLDTNRYLLAGSAVWVQI